MSQEFQVGDQVQILIDVVEDERNEHIYAGDVGVISQTIKYDSHLGPMYLLLFKGAAIWVGSSQIGPIFKAAELANQTEGFNTFIGKPLC